MNKQLKSVIDRLFKQALVQQYETYVETAETPISYAEWLATDLGVTARTNSMLFVSNEVTTAISDANRSVN